MNRAKMDRCSAERIAALEAQRDALLSAAKALHTQREKLELTYDNGYALLKAFDLWVALAKAIAAAESKEVSA